MTQHCMKCSGTGTYLGQGMMMTECERCSGMGYHEKLVPLEKIDRKSKSYKTAIKEIMDINPSISRDDAVKMFDKAYEKN